MKKVLASILLIIMIVIIATFSFIGGGSGTSSFNNQDSEVYQDNSLNATATFGAQEFHLQLTAIAEQDQ